MDCYYTFSIDLLPNGNSFGASIRECNYNPNLVWINNRLLIQKFYFIKMLFKKRIQKRWKRKCISYILIFFNRKIEKLWKENIHTFQINLHILRKSAFSLEKKSGIHKVEEPYADWRPSPPPLPPPLSSKKSDILIHII